MGNHWKTLYRGVTIFNVGFGNNLFVTGLELPGWDGRSRSRLLLVCREVSPTSPQAQGVQLWVPEINAEWTQRGSSHTPWQVEISQVKEPEEEDQRDIKEPRANITEDGTLQAAESWGSKYQREHGVGYWLNSGLWPSQVFHLWAAKTLEVGPTPLTYLSGLKETNQGFAVISGLSEAGNNIHKSEISMPSGQTQGQCGVTSSKVLPGQSRVVYNVASGSWASLAQTWHSPYEPSTWKLKWMGSRRAEV